MSLKKIEPEHRVSLKDYTSIKIGGDAKHFYEANGLDDLKNASKEFNGSFYLLGKGSNLLIKDTLIEKPVLKLGSEFSFINESRGCLEVGASTPLSSLLQYCLKNNLSGLENLVGIPATIGGLLAMNASSFGTEISACLKDVEVMDKNGEISVLQKDEIDFGYRYCSLQDSIILKARINVVEAKGLRLKMASLFAKRLSTQDFKFPSCGCIFKNPADASVGTLIESCNFKGLKQGNAQVSLQHANFIVNLGGAKYSDVEYLITKIKDQIYKKYSIILEEEIKRWE